MKPIEGLERYTESISFSNRMIKKADSSVIKESLSGMPEKLRESVGNEVSEGWWVPISHFGNYKNGNGRIYNTRLWKNVIENQRDVWKGSGMLMDHPAGDSDGNPRDICGVWLDCRMGDPGPDGVGLVYGLLVPSGRLGQDLRDHLKNGLKIGTSSSGFGKMMKDGVTVDPDTYQIERLADFVLNPSQGTFFSWDESSDKIDDVIRESIGTPDIDTEFKETVVKDSKLTRLEEKKLRRDIESFLESANNIKDPQERLEELKDLRSYIEEGACPDLREKVENKISEQEAFIKQMLDERMEMKEDLGIDSTRDLKEKLTKIEENSRLAEKEAKDWKGIAEKLQEKLEEAREELERRPTREFVEFQKSRLSSMTKMMESHDSKSADIVKKLAEEYRRTKEELESTRMDLSESLKRNEELGKSLSESEKTAMSYREKLKESENRFKESNDSIARYREALERYKNLFETQREKFEETISKAGILKEENERMKGDVSILSREAKDAQMRLRKESALRIARKKKNLTDTESFYEELYRTYGNDIVPYRERIVGSRSLSDAKMTFYHEILDNLRESRKIDDMRIPEGVYSPAKRASLIDGNAFYKQSMMERMPKGWK